jgi:hypothetical protein
VVARILEYMILTLCQVIFGDELAFAWVIWASSWPSGAAEACVSSCSGRVSAGSKSPPETTWISVAPLARVLSLTPQAPRIVNPIVLDSGIL